MAKSADGQYGSFYNDPSSDAEIIKMTIKNTIKLIFYNRL